MRAKLPTDPARSALMRRMGRARTKPEEVVARALGGLGARYRRNRRGLPGSPDFSNRRAGWALFVNGCYWHHHGCPRGTSPTRNAAFWLEKFRANRARDAEKIRALRRLGLRVAVVWECETADAEGLRTRLTRFLPPR